MSQVITLSFAFAIQKETRVGSTRSALAGSSTGPGSVGLGKSLSGSLSLAAIGAFNSLLPQKRDS